MTLPCRAVHPAGPALLAAALAVAASVAGLHGTDQAAQVFRVLEVRRNGVTLFDSAWYGGTYPLAYSVVLPVLGALIGLGATAAVASAAASWAFDRLVVRATGARNAACWYFATSTLVQVAVGQVPFLAGEAFGLASALALVDRRRGVAVVLAVGCGLCSPLAAAFLTLAVVAWSLRSRTSWPLVTALATTSTVGALALAFPGDGYFPFPWTELAVIGALCAVVLVGLVPAPGTVRVAAAVYGVAALASYAVPNPLGGNAGRFASAIGVPVLLCAVGRPRAGRALVVLVPFVAWQWAPGLSATRQGGTSDPAFYSPLVARLAGVAPGRRRIEVVPTAEHWESAFVATSPLSLARGWERQVDTARNPLFYRPGALTASTYRAWLVANGVSWVALPDTGLDYAGVGEAALLRAGHVPGLTEVWHTPTWTLWGVDGGPGIVSGPATLASSGADTVRLDAYAPGTVTVRLRWTSYWHLDGDGCTTASAAGWTEVRVARPGVFVLHAQLLPDRGPDCASG